jgi:hypothetical protein
MSEQPAGLGTCEAARPAAMFAEWGWRECGQPAIAVYDWTCPREHSVRKGVCAAHEPVPGLVGCRQCFNDGHDDAEMTAQLIERTGEAKGDL